MAEDGRLTLNVPQAAAMLGVSVPTAWQMVHSGQIKAIKCGKRRYVVPRKALEALLA
jgi:excisionase family DNA binding protein